MALRSNGAPDVTDWDAAHFLTFNCRHWRPLDEADATGAIWGRLNCLRPLLTRRNRRASLHLSTIYCALGHWKFHLQFQVVGSSKWNYGKFTPKMHRNLLLKFHKIGKYFSSIFSNFGDLNAVPSSTWATAAKNWWTFRGTSCYTGTLCAKHKPSTDSVSQFLIFKLK